MYLQARQRSQAVAQGLSMRMGMSRRAHRRSLSIELGSTLLVTFVLAVVLAIVAVVLMVPHLDPLARIPPALLLEVPLVSILGALVALVAAVWLGAWAAERRAGAIPLGEVMRVAD
jgi:putative ABC transport system permease protein